MRIVGGKYRGRVFNPDKRFTARPTTDIAKEALFNILANRYDLSEMKILDLFSGTGSIGYEFLSREASEVTFVEKDPHHVRFIRKTIELLKAENARIIQDDVFRFLKNTPYKFDLIFADPPFDFPFLPEVPPAIFNSDILSENGVLIVEHSKNHNFTKLPNFEDLRKYGKVNFSFFIK